MQNELVSVYENARLTDLHTISSSSSYFLIASLMGTLPFLTAHRVGARLHTVFRAAFTFISRVRRVNIAL